MGPVAVSVSTNTDDWRYYSGGIIQTKKCGWMTDHIVVAVGYGEEPNGDQPAHPYLIIKNTWGPNWGEDGYARISLRSRKGLFGGNGICNILSDGNYGATVKIIKEEH